MVCVMDSLPEFLAKSDEYVYKLADNLLDALTNGEHSKTLKETEPVSKCSATTKKQLKLEPLEIKKKVLNIPLFYLSFKQQVEERNSQEAKKDKEVKFKTQPEEVCFHVVY